MPPPRLDIASPSDKKAKRVEQLADNFAAGLLMPKPLIERLTSAPPPTDQLALSSWLNSNAQLLGVSAVALQWRLVNTGKLSKAFVVNEELLRNNGVSQRAKPPAKFGKRFMEILGWGVDEGYVSVRRAATLLNVTVDEFHALFESHGLSAPFDL